MKRNFKIVVDVKAELTQLIRRGAVACVRYAEWMSENELPNNGPVNYAFLNKLRWMGFIEGVSTLILFFVAMPLKYLANKPIAVEIAGSIHGGLFVCLVLMLAISIWRVPLKISLSLMGMLSAVLPFGPFVFDHWLKKIALPSDV